MAIFELFIIFNTCTVERRVETLVYDFPTFLAAAGGNLGLCLGCSCLSMLFGITKIIKIVAQRTVRTASFTTSKRSEITMKRNKKTTKVTLFLLFFIY